MPESSHKSNGAATTDRRKSVEQTGRDVPTVADIERTLRRLSAGSDNHAIELRAPGFVDARGEVQNVVSRFGPGRFAAAAAEAHRLSGHAPAVYLVMNGVRPTLRLGCRITGGAKASDVPSRRWLLLDFDPERPPDANATDDEKQTAFDLAETVRAFLRDRGWPEPITADSGNGGHLLYRLDLPNDAESTKRIKAALAALARRFDTPGCKIDRKVFDAPRLVKLYGTLAAKGPDTPDRPHRFSRIMTAPEDPGVVAPELLDDLADDLADEPPSPAPTPQAQAKANTGTTSGGGRPDAAERAALYLNACAPAVSGKKGHNQAFKVACKVGPGFDLDPDVAERLILNLYNPRCDPPWSDKEVRHKIDEAYKVEKRRGWLLNADRNPGPNGNGRHHEANGKGGDGRHPANGRHGANGERPKIVVTTERHEVIDQAVNALASDPRVYQRSHALVSVRRDVSHGDGFIRDSASPFIAALPLPTLGECLTETAEWVRFRRDREGDREEVPAHPPDWAINAVAARGEWPEIRHLESVIETPVLRPDGSILETPGYDLRTGILYEPGADFPPVKAKPDRGDAERAAAELLDVVSDFPFARPFDSAAWLAGALTQFARFAIRGPCPLFAIDATVAGSGKTLLIDIDSNLASGRSVARNDYPEDNAEMRKLITAVALAGERMMLLDNVDVAFGGSAIDAAVSARSTWKDRLLGRSEMVVMPLFTVWYATGNNMTFRGDMVRRVVPCRLESPQERPEERGGFKIKGDLITHVLSNRPSLVRAALTILRAYQVAGRPAQGLTPLGTFEAWSEVVRDPIYWATGLDACEGKKRIMATDPKTIGNAALVNGWAELPDAVRGVTAAEALAYLADGQNASRYETLRNALMAWSRNGDLPSPVTIGKKLSAIRGAVIDDKYLEACEVARGAIPWRIVFKRDDQR